MAFVRQRKEDFAAPSSAAFFPFANYGKEDQRFAFHVFWKSFS
jgi:hypothetical protein